MSTLNADEQAMRSYLLGTLDSDRRTQLEQTILSAPESREELLIAEEELIDLYVAGGLTKLEQQQFETNFLITAERQRNLRFGQLLQRYVNSHPVPTGEMLSPGDYDVKLSGVLDSGADELIEKYSFRVIE